MPSCASHGRRRWWRRRGCRRLPRFPCEWHLRRLLRWLLPSTRICSGLQIEGSCPEPRRPSGVWEHPSVGFWAHAAMVSRAIMGATSSGVRSSGDEWDLGRLRPSLPALRRSLGKCREEGFARQLVPRTADDTVHESGVRRFARRDGVPGQAGLLAPSQNGHAGQFGASCRGRRCWGELGAP